jgi:hypothetical protein
MTEETQILDALASAGGPLCDDCVTTSVGWNERQQAHAVASRLADRDVIVRAVGICSRCGRRRVASALPPAAVGHEGSQTTDSPHEQRARIAKLLQGGQLEGEAIAAEVGVPRGVVSAVEAEVAMDAYSARERVAEADARVATLEVTCGLERDLQVALRADIQQLETGLRIVDDGRDQVTDAGRIDITAQDADGITVVIELRAGKTAPAALTQLLAHMDAVAGEDQSAVRGILVAGDFHPDIVVAARATPNVQLRRYHCTFTFEAAE